MGVKIEVESKVTIETTAYIHEGKLKTNPCEIGLWWGDETCKEVDFNKEIEETNIPEGEYMITITMVKVKQ